MRKTAAALLLAISLPVLADDFHAGAGYVDPSGAVRVTLDHAKRFTCSLAGLAATLTECQALSAGRTYYITDIAVQTTTGTAGTYAIQTGTGANCVTGTTALFPVNATSARFAAPISTQPTAFLSFTTPLVTTAGHAICVIGTAVNTINIQISGYYTP